MCIYIYTCIYIDTTHFFLEKCGGFTLSTLMYLIYVRELFGWYILIFTFACRMQWWSKSILSRPIDFFCGDVGLFCENIGLISVCVCVCVCGCRMRR